MELLTRAAFAIVASWGWCSSSGGNENRGFQFLFLCRLSLSAFAFSRAVSRSNVCLAKPGVVKGEPRPEVKAKGTWAPAPVAAGATPATPRSGSVLGLHCSTRRTASAARSKSITRRSISSLNRDQIWLTVKPCCEVTT
jgi:hypothetical protein